MSDIPSIKVYEPMKVEDEKRKMLNPRIPRPPFRCIMIGQTGSGKTNLIKNFLFTKGFYKDYFDQIYLWCGSMDDCEEYERLMEDTKYKVFNEKKGEFYKSKKGELEDKMSVSHGVDATDLHELFNELETNEETEDDRFLWVFDDMIVNKLLQSKGRMNILDEAFVRGRHIGAGLSLILSTQKYRQLSQNMRISNSSHLFIYHGISKLDLNAIANEASGILDDEEFKTLFKDNVKKKFQFLVIQLRESPEKMFLNSKFEYIDVQKYNGTAVRAE